jgi:predicted acyl esterase
MSGTYMTEDQRFAASRPDVLVYRTEVLDHDVTVLGSIKVDLKASTTGTDSDFVVKVIDVLPGDFPDYNDPGPVVPGVPQVYRVPMGGYQQLIRGEPFRGKFRKSFEKPVAFEPGKADRITFELPWRTHFARVTASWCRCRARGSR